METFKPSPPLNVHPGAVQSAGGQTLGSAGLWNEDKNIAEFGSYAIAWLQLQSELAKHSLKFPAEHLK